MRRRTFARSAAAALITLSLTGALAAVPGANAAPRPAAAVPQVALPHTSTANAAPPMRFTVQRGSYFSFPNTTQQDEYAIHDKVLNSVKSTWGGPRNRYGGAVKRNGTIRMATWSFKDWGMAHALVAAYHRGVSVQVMAARSANVDSAPWHWLQQQLGTRLARKYHPDTLNGWSFARDCAGACRGHYGTAHAKYYLFNNVGKYHRKHITVQTSMNLTRFAHSGQWNQARVQWDLATYEQFSKVFNEARLDVRQKTPYRAYSAGQVLNIFYPLPGGSATSDPVMTLLNKVTCKGATAGDTNGHTVIRINQYAIYGTRGQWIAQKIRSLWDHGCDIKIIYGVSSRRVLSILRAKTGRGAIPMRQSGTKDKKGVILTYNHSKWIAISGRWGGSTKAFVVMSGSSNWADYAFSSDEQVEQITGGYYLVHPYRSNFNKTWNQKTSHPPTPGGTVSGRTMPDEPTLGKGIYVHMSND
jgi:hypothetical protein